MDPAELDPDSPQVGPAETADTGIEPLDHAADVGLQLRAATLAELFDRAAIALTALLIGDAPPAAESPTQTEQRQIAGEAADEAMLLVFWLRELLYLRQVHGFVYERAEFDRLDAQQLRARVRGSHDARPPAREIKGVTYHALEVAHRDGEWRARVIFDV